MQDHLQRTATCGQVSLREALSALYICDKLDEMPDALKVERMGESRGRGKVKVQGVIGREKTQF